MYKKAKPSDLQHEITAADMEIRRQEERKRSAQQALDTLAQSGEAYVGENEDKEEARRKKAQQTRELPATEHPHPTSLHAGTYEVPIS